MKKVLCIILFLLFWGAVDAVTPKKLFHEKNKQEDKHFVYDFLARYFSELQNINDQSFLMQKLYDDKVFFVQGNVKDIKSLSPEMSFSLKCFDDRYYEACWSENQNIVVTVMFTVSFELFLGNPKNVIEMDLYDEITKESIASHTPI